MNNTAILLYHRVIDISSDPQLLSVSPWQFENQLLYLKDKYNVVSLRQLVEQVKCKGSFKKQIAITFDDGYFDNFRYAAPLLIKYNLPATFFVSTGYSETGREYWWDELERLLLISECRSGKLRIKIEDRHYEWELSDNKDSSNDLSWNVLHKTFPTRRHKAYVELCSIFHAFQYEEVISALSQLNKCLNSRETRLTHRPLNITEVQQLSNNSLFEIGCHTRNHLCLASLSPSQQDEEIRRAKDDIQRWVGEEIKAFSYPFGTKEDYNDESVRLVRKAGFEYAVSNFKGEISREADLYQMPRFLVRNWPLELFKAKLDSCFNFLQ
jgi:peptidoglycan/xylan/chitin deacetylase (PgdA/CDA1 family)